MTAKVGLHLSCHRQQTQSTAAGGSKRKKSYCSLRSRCGCSISCSKTPKKRICAAARMVLTWAMRLRNCCYFLHCSPHTPSETHQWILDTIANTKGLTHFVHCGDVFDESGLSASRRSRSHLDGRVSSRCFFSKHPPELAGWVSLGDLQGNHDDNIRRADPSGFERSERPPYG